MRSANRFSPLTDVTADVLVRGYDAGDDAETEAESFRNFGNRVETVPVPLPSAYIFCSRVGRRGSH